MRASWGRTGLAGVLLLALWALGGALVFLLAPGVSHLPLAGGALAGLSALALQLLFGERLLRGLLRLDFEPPAGTGLAAWIDEERPFLVALGSRPDLVATRGLVEGLPDALPGLAAELRGARAGPAGFLLTRALALPCLLRAFEAVTVPYSRVRGGSGPLWALARAFRLLAQLLEAPLEPLRLPPAGGGSPERRDLEEALASVSGFPAWMEALGPLAPASVAGARRRARFAALRGAEAPDLPVPPSRVDRFGRWAPALGLGLGILGVRVPGVPLAAPLLLGALGLAFRTLRELPMGRPADGSLEALWQRARDSGRGVPVRLEGRCSARPEGLAVPEGDWLDTGGGRVLLVEAPVGEDGVRVVTGWMRPGDPEVLVGTWEGSGRVRRGFPLVRRLLLPGFLGLVGLAWWALQAVGL